MTKTAITVLTCDRCSREDEGRKSDDLDAWGKVAFQSKAGPVKIGVTMEIDICPACFAELDQWWNQPRGTGK